MIKTLLIQSLYTLGDDPIEYQINDRFSLMRYLKLTLRPKFPIQPTLNDENKISSLVRNQAVETQTELVNMI